MDPNEIDVKRLRIERRNSIVNLFLLLATSVSVILNFVFKDEANDYKKANKINALLFSEQAENIKTLTVIIDSLRNSKTGANLNEFPEVVYTVTHAYRNDDDISYEVTLENIGNEYADSLIVGLTYYCSYCTDIHLPKHHNYKLISKHEIDDEVNVEYLIMKSMAPGESNKFFYGITSENMITGDQHKVFVKHNKGSGRNLTI